MEAQHKYSDYKVIINLNGRKLAARKCIAVEAGPNYNYIYILFCLHRVYLPFAQATRCVMSKGG